MKAIFTILFIIICGVVALANNHHNQLPLNPQIENQYEVKFIKMGTNMDSGIVIASSYNEVETTTETKVVRLYKFNNKKSIGFYNKKE